MNIGWAIDRLKSGDPVRRSKWKPDDHLRLIPSLLFSKEKLSEVSNILNLPKDENVGDISFYAVLAFFHANTSMYEFGPQISLGDLFADDWVEY